MKRDKGWIHTMLEDAENERMHLLTFMEIAKPGWIARMFALLAQGVFYNFFFVFYLASPKTAHRFVGYIEEEAVLTYSFILEDLKQGRLPEWENVAAPEIAKQYWQLGEEAMLVDVIRAVRADEATHRHINHTFASWRQPTRIHSQRGSHQQKCARKRTDWNERRRSNGQVARTWQVAKLARRLPRRRPELQRDQDRLEPLYTISIMTARITIPCRRDILSVFAVFPPLVVQERRAGDYERG